MEHKLKWSYYIQYVHKGNVQNDRSHNVNLQKKKETTKTIYIIIKFSVSGP